MDSKAERRVLAPQVDGQPAAIESCEGMGAIPASVRKIGLGLLAELRTPMRGPG
jgi:hypothetical protein